MSEEHAAFKSEGGTTCFRVCLGMAEVGLVSMKQQSSLLDCSACPKLHGAAKCSAGILGWDAPGGLKDEGCGAAAAAAGRICFLLKHRCRQTNCLKHTTHHAIV